MARLLDEYTRNLQWQTHTYYGISWTWNNYVVNTRTPEESAQIWCGCYEVSGGVEYRQENARYWYDYFSGQPPTPPTPDDWISGTAFSTLALAYDPDVTGVPIPYSQMDCITFVQTVWRDIQAVSSSDTLCSPLGTNTLWRTNTNQYPNLVKTFNTTSPDNQNPCPVLWYKDTITNCISAYGEIPAGTLLLHQISEAGPPAIPAQYAGDGVGNFAHIGIYVGNNEVMQSGGRDSGSVPGGGVHKSAYDSSAWNYAAFVVYVDPTGSGPGPGPEPPTPSFPDWLLMWYTNKRKVIKNVKRYV
jgi:cell wall-associated NlpC family hydrolase